MRVGCSKDGKVVRGCRNGRTRSDEGEVAYRIYNLRMALSLTQKAFGERIGAFGETVCSWEKGRVLPSTDTIILIAREYGASADYLLGITPDDGPIFSAAPACSYGYWDGLPEAVPMDF